jgi:hypothetical protein
MNDIEASVESVKEGVSMCFDEHNKFKSPQKNLKEIELTDN